MNTSYARSPGLIQTVYFMQKRLTCSNTSAILLTAVFSCMDTVAIARNGVLTGKVVDEKEGSLAYANVTLLKAADTF